MFFNRANVESVKAPVTFKSSRNKGEGMASFPSSLCPAHKQEAVLCLLPFVGGAEQIHSLVFRPPLCFVVVPVFCFACFDRLRATE